MPPVVIENPVINSPFVEPTRHFRFGEDGITNEVVQARRISSYFIPIPPRKMKGPQLALPGDWTAERIQPNVFINRIRERVAIWRQGGYLGITHVTRGSSNTGGCRTASGRSSLSDRGARSVYLSEVGPRYGDAWIDNQLREANESANLSRGLDVHDQP